MATLLKSRLLWEIAIVGLLVLALVTQRHRLDRLRGMVAAQEVAAQLSALNQDAVRHATEARYWKDQASQHEAAMQSFARLLESVQRRRPVRSAVAKKVQEATLTDAGLEDETRRVLPGVGFRLARDCR